MAELHNGVLNSVYGPMRTDEEFNAELKRVMEIGKTGYNLQYFVDKFHRVKVKRGGEWWVMATLAEYDDFYKV